MSRIRMTLAAAAVAATAFVSACSPIGDDGDAEALNVLGAASTRVLNDDLSANFDEAPLEFHNAGSSTLIQQLGDGMPGDVFISADQRTMDQAQAKDLVEDPQMVAHNSMVMVVPKDNPAHITGVDSSLEGATVVLCDVQVPCGAVSQDIQKDLSLTIKAASLEQSVSDVLSKVVSGEADAGWVYRTDATAAGDDIKVIDIPRADAHANALLAAVTKNSAQPDKARALVDFLSSSEGAKIWSDHGFNPAKN